MKAERKKLGKGIIALIVVLAAAVTAVLYVTLFLNGIRSATEQVQLERAETESLLTVEQAKAGQMAAWKEALKEDGIKDSAVETYDNAKTELKVLNDILEKADTYAVNFEDPYTTDGTTVRRPLTLTFRAGGYDVAHSILYNIECGGFRCLLGDVSVTDTESYLMETPSGLNGNTEPVSVTVSMSYIETLDGAEDDSGVTYIQQEKQEYDETDVYK